MAIKQRKQITGTTEQINAYAGVEGLLVWDKTKKKLVGMSGTAGTNYPMASESHTHSISDVNDLGSTLTAELAKKANLSHTHKSDQITDLSDTLAPYAKTASVNASLEEKANKSHTHTVSQITDMPKVVLSVNNITPNDSGNVPLGLHAIATSGNYNDLTNKPHIPANTSNWSVSGGGNGWARDNSTGFTIVWGSVGPGARASFARTFGSVLAVALGPWDSRNYSWGNELNNAGFKHNSSGWCKYIAVGFS